MKTLEEEIVLAAVALYKQGEKAQDMYGSCEYYNCESENKCAIGHMMTEQELAMNQNSTDAVDLLIETGSWRKDLMNNERAILELSVFQKAHDDAGTKSFRSSFLHNLKTSNSIAAENAYKAIVCLGL